MWQVWRERFYNFCASSNKTATELALFPEAIALQAIQHGVDSGVEGNKDYAGRVNRRINLQTEK